MIGQKQTLKWLIKSSFLTDSALIELVASVDYCLTVEKRLYFGDLHTFTGLGKGPWAFVTPINATNLCWVCFIKVLVLWPILKSLIDRRAVLHRYHDTRVVIYDLRGFMRWATASGQSYKHFMLINYNSSVVIWGVFKSGTTLES